MNKLTNPQRDELIQQFVEIQVDNMDTKTLVQIVSDNLTEYYDNLSDNELKCEIEGLYDENLYNELVDNVASDPSPYDQIPTRY
tara:strand:- start:669 stop:920 length:252 start_codon:yes stop_codon:yes gene_type:complete